ncbi:MAG: hypothetical protein CO070_03650, partial [Gallionellales bacterium CG_4_9_14_0_8_um_filter_55_61]
IGNREQASRRNTRATALQIDPKMSCQVRDSHTHLTDAKLSEPRDCAGMPPMQSSHNGMSA